MSVYLPCKSKKDVVFIEARRNLCAQIPESLHTRVRQEQDALGKTLSQYVEEMLTEHFTVKGDKSMEGTRTLALQIPEELFERLKVHLKSQPKDMKISQKQFIIDLIQRALDEADEGKNQ